MAALAQGHWLQASTSSLPQGHIQSLVRRYPPNTAKWDYSGPHANNFAARKLFELNLRASWPVKWRNPSMCWCMHGHQQDPKSQITPSMMSQGVYLWSNSLFTGMSSKLP